MSMTASKERIWLVVFLFVTGVVSTNGDVILGRLSVYEQFGPIFARITAVCQLMQAQVDQRFPGLISAASPLSFVLASVVIFWAVIVLASILVFWTLVIFSCVQLFLRTYLWEGVHSVFLGIGSPILALYSILLTFLNSRWIKRACREVAKGSDNVSLEQQMNAVADVMRACQMIPLDMVNRRMLTSDNGPERQVWWIDLARALCDVRKNLQPLKWLREVSLVLMHDTLIEESTLLPFSIIYLRRTTYPLNT